MPQRRTRMPSTGSVRATAMNPSRAASCLFLVAFFAIAAASAQAAPAFIVAQDAEAAARAVTSAGGEVHHVFPPHVLFVEARDRAALARLPGIVSVASSEVRVRDLARWGEAAVLAAGAWNDTLRPHLAPERTGLEPGPIRNDMRRLPDPVAPLALADLAAAPTFGAQRYDTSEYMVGKIAVGIILPESTGNAENWTATQRQQVVSAILQAMEWWRARRPSAHLSFYYDVHLSLSTTYEPIRMSSQNEGQWISDVMNRLGYTGSTYFEQVYSYDNAIRNSLNTNWAFATFVVNSASHPRGTFTDGAFAYSYLGGPFTVMTYDNDGYGIAGMPATSAHETGHIFYALDEYSGSGSSATDQSGYFNAVNGNFIVGGVTNDACVMRGQVAPYNSGAVCSFTHGQLGHQDVNSDGVEDVVEVPPETTLTPHSPNPTTQTQLTYVGACTVVALTNLNSKDNTQPPDNITINTIAGVDYRVDGGPWQPALASDGAFDEPQEDFTFTVILAPATHTIEARARDTALNVDSTPASDTVTITPAAPQVAQTTPANGASNVSTATAISATFDQSMNASTLNTNTFIVRAGSTSLSGSVTYNDATRTATFVPASALPASASITATILSGANGVQSATGLAMASDYVWSFATGVGTAWLSSGYVMPSSGDASTRFTWRVKYWSTTNAAPDEVWVAIRTAGTGTISWRRMWAYNPSNTNYASGAWFTYSAYLGGGQYAFRFATRAGAEWEYWPQPAGSYVTWLSVNPVILSSGYVTPTSGTPATNFTFRVKYWNTKNVSPDVIWLAVWSQNRNGPNWYPMSPLDPFDTTYADGAWFTRTVSGLDTSAHSFRFVAQQGANSAYLPAPAGAYQGGPTLTP